ncbi:PH domain-containing protein [Plasmodiophora brassicae]
MPASSSTASDGNVNTGSAGDDDVAARAVDFAYESFANQLQLKHYLFPLGGAADEQPANKLTWSVGAKDILDQFWTDECYHRKALKSMVSTMDILGDMLNDREMDSVFGNTRDRFALDQGFYFHLQNLIGENVLFQNICPVILVYAPLFRLYKDFASGYKHGVLTLQRIRLESPRIAKIIDLANDVPLETLMYSSVNRVSRLLVTLSRLRRLHDALDMKVPDDLNEAYRLIGALSHEISNAQCHRREIDQLRDIQERLFNGRVTIANGLRFLVRYGVLEKVDKTRYRFRLALPKKYLFVLCNDLLLYGTPTTSSAPSLIKRILPTSGMRLEVLSPTRFRIDSPMKSLEVVARDPPHARKWIADIRRTLEMESLQKRIRELPTNLKVEPRTEPALAHSIKSSTS